MSGCIYRGTGTDAATSFSYASANAYCYYTKPAIPIKLMHQTTHCLCQNHADCPLLATTITPTQRNEIIRQPIKQQNPLIETRSLFRWMAVFSLLAIYSFMLIYW